MADWADSLHAPSELDGRYVATDDPRLEAAALAWGDIADKPATFPPDSHNHDSRYYTEAEVDTALAGKVATDDSRLTNARTPTAHTHAAADLSGVAKSVVLGSPVNVSGNNAFADITGLAVAVLNGVPTRFQFMILWGSAATTTGARFSLNGPAFTNLAYMVRWNTTATVVTTAPLGTSYNQNFTAGTDANTASNLAIIEGIVIPSADGNLLARFANEVNGSAITARAGSSVLYW